MSRLSFVEILSDQESEAEEGEIDIFGEKSKRETSPPFRVIHLVEDNDDDNKEGDDDEKEEGEIDIFEKKSQCTGKTKARAERRKRKREKAKRLSEQEEATEANGVNKASAIEVDDTDKDEMSFMPMDSGPLRKSAKINAVKSPYLSNFLKRAREPSVGLVPVLEPLNDLYLKNFHDEQAKSSFLPHERSDQDEEDNTSIGSASSNVSSSIQESLAVSFEVDPSRARLKVSQVPCELCNSDDLIKAARNVDIVIYKATPIFQGASADISTSAFLEIDNSSNDLEISMITLQNGLVPTQEIKVEKLDSASYSFPSDYQVHALSSSTRSLPISAEGDDAKRGQNYEIVRIFNLPYDMTAVEVEERATRAGLDIVNLKMDMSRTTGAPAGSATMKVVEKETNASIVERMIGDRWGGRPIRVESSSQQTRGKKRERRYFDEIPPCSLCGGTDHEAFECSSMTCFRCGGIGHIAKDCSLLSTYRSSHTNRRAISAPPRTRNVPVSNVDGNYASTRKGRSRYEDDIVHRSQKGRQQFELYLAPEYGAGSSRRDYLAPEYGAGGNRRDYDDEYKRNSKYRRWSDGGRQARVDRDNFRRDGNRDH